MSLFDKIMIAWGEEIRRNSSLRMGQNLISALHRVSPKVYQKLMNPVLRETYDCFYDDGKIQPCFEWLKNNAKEE